MHIYLVSDVTDPAQHKVHETRGDAQAHARDAYIAVFRPDVRIRLLDVNTDKASIVWLLNNPEKLHELAEEGAIRTWKMTRRGGLKELAK